MSERLKSLANSSDAGPFPASLHRLTDSDFARKVAETFATRIALLALGIATSVLTTRLLGPEGRGALAVASALTALGVQIGDLGLSTANTVFAAKERATLPALIGNTLAVSLLLGGLLGLAFLELASLWASFTPLHGFLLLLAAGGIAVGLASGLGLNLLMGVQDTRSYNHASLCSAALYLLFVLLLFAGRVVSTTATLAANLLALTLAAILAYRRLRNYAPISLRLDVSLFRRTLNYGLRFYILYFASFMIMRSDMLLVGSRNGEKQAGLYAVAVTLAGLINILPNVAGMILMPRLAAMDDLRERWRIARRMSAATAVLLALVCGICGLLARPIILLMYGAKFEAAVPAFLWLLPGNLFIGLIYALTGYIGSVKPRSGLLVGYYAAFALNLGLNLLFVSRYGIGFAAANSSLCYGLMLLALWHFSVRPMAAEAARYQAAEKSA